MAIWHRIAVVACAAASSIVETPDEGEPLATSQACTVICTTPSTITSRSVVMAPPVVHVASLPQAVPSVANRTTSVVRACPLFSPPVIPSDILEHEPLPHCPQQPATSLTESNSSRDSTVFLSTAVIRVKDVNDVYHFARALLDSGSPSNFYFGGSVSEVEP